MTYNFRSVFLTITTQGTLVYILITLLNEERSSQEITSGMGKVWSLYTPDLISTNFWFMQNQENRRAKQTNENNPPGNQLLPRLPRVAVPQDTPPFCFWGSRRHRGTSHLLQTQGCHSCPGPWVHRALASSDRGGACNCGKGEEVKTLFIFLSPGQVQWLGTK